MAKPMTQARLAEKLGLSQQQVSKLARAGMPTDSVAAARKWRAANLDPVRGGKPAAPGDLAHWRIRKTAAEATILEHRAAVGPQGTVEVAAIERALRRLFVASQVHADSLHPKLLEGVTDALCARTDPRYPATYAAIHAVLRNFWADGWMLQADAFVTEAPELREVFLRMAALHAGPNSAAAKMLAAGKGDA